MSHDNPAQRLHAQRVWLAENLARGVPQERLVARLEELGLPLAEARAEVETAGRHPGVRVMAQHVPELDGILALLRSYTALYRQAGWHQRLERRANVPSHEFFERYYFPNRPVVLQGLLDHWPPLERWRPERLAERFGEVEVEIMSGRESDPQHDIAPDLLRARVRLGAFLRQLLTVGPSNDAYLTARNFALQRTELRELLDDVHPIPGYLRAPEPQDVRLWIGPAGTVTAMHHDLNALFSCQLYGRKHFKLAPPFESASLYNRHTYWSSVDAARPDLERYPAYREADILEVVLEPGEVLFLPVGWWHWVHALDVSVSVSVSSFDLPDRIPVWRIRHPELPGPKALSAS